MIAAMIEAGPKKISKRFLPVVAQVTTSARKRLRNGAESGGADVHATGISAL